MWSFKLVKRKKVRGRIKHFFKKSVSASSLLITVATSCKLWIATLADREEYFTQFYLRKFEQKNVGLLEGNINVIHVRVEWSKRTRYLLSEKKLLFSEDIESQVLQRLERFLLYLLMAVGSCAHWAPIFNSSPLEIWTLGVYLAKQPMNIFICNSYS